MNRLYLSQPFTACYENDLAAFIPQLWAQEGLQMLEGNLVMASMVHRDFEDTDRQVRRRGEHPPPRRVQDSPQEGRHHAGAAGRHGHQRASAVGPVVLLVVRDPRRGGQQVLPGVEHDLPPAGHEDHRRGRRTRPAGSGPRLPGQPGEPRRQARRPVGQHRQGLPCWKPTSG